MEGRRLVLYRRREKEIWSICRWCRWWWRKSTHTIMYQYLRCVCITMQFIFSSVCVWVLQCFPHRRKADTSSHSGDCHHESGCIHIRMRDSPATRPGSIKEPGLDWTRASIFNLLSQAHTHGFHTFTCISPVKLHLCWWLISPAAACLCRVHCEGWTYLFQADYWTLIDALSCFSHPQPIVPPAVWGGGLFQALWATNVR